MEWRFVPLVVGALSAAQRAVLVAAGTHLERSYEDLQAAPPKGFGVQAQAAADLKLFFRNALPPR